MNAPTDPSGRLRLAMGTTLCAISLCLAPLAARSALNISNERRLLTKRFPQPQITGIRTPIPVAILRDPFVPEQERTSASHLSNTGATSGRQVVQGSAIDGFPRVEAIVTGGTARALVEEGGQQRIVREGEPLAGTKVRAIVPSGVQLQNGLTIPLTGGYQ